jgi:hypothetical protein
MLAVALIGSSFAVRASAAPLEGWASTFADQSAGTFLWLNTTVGGMHEGRFLVAVEGEGLFWGTQAATITDGAGGTQTVTYSGPGWSNADGLFSPLTWQFQLTGDPQQIQISLVGTIDATGTSGSFTIDAGGTAYQLDDDVAPSGAVAVASNIANLMQGGNWADLYATLHPMFRNAVDQTTFTTGMANGIGSQGALVNVVLTSTVEVVDSGTGWNVGTAGLAISVERNGRTATYNTELELVADGSTWYLSNLGEIKPDVSAPTSSANPLPATITTSPLAVSFVATDTGVGVDEVELWWRSRPNAGSPWSAWAEGPSGPSSPISFSLPAAGDYEFYTIAIDRADNREAAPATADAATTYQAGATWTPAVQVNDDAGSHQQDRPSVAIGPDGAAYLIWDDYRPGTQADIYFSRRDPATGTWSANQRVNGDTSNRTQYQADIAVDGASNAYAVWQDPRNGNHTPDPDIYFSKRTATSGTWGTNLRVNGDTQGAPAQYAPAIAVQSDGAAVAAWVDLRSNQWNIYSARLPAGGSTWGTNLRVTSNTTSRKDGPDIVVGPDGTAYAVWEDDRTGNYDIWYAKLLAGSSTWSTNVKVSDDPGSAAQYGARIGVDSAGNLLVVWLDDRPAPRTEVRMARLLAGTSIWTASVVVSDSQAIAGSAALGVRPNGNAYAVWEDARGISWDIWGTSYDAAAGAWGTPALVSDDPGSSAQRAPTVAFTDAQLVAAWRDHRTDTVQGDIFARRR